MAEENKGIAVPGEGEGSQAAPKDFEVRQAEAMETKARSLGWKPQDEYEGDPAEWRSAKEFVDRQSLFDKIKSVKDDNYHLKRENSEMKRDLAVIRDYVKKMSETEYTRAMADLRNQKKAAVAEADVNAVAEIDKQLDTLRETRAEVQKPQQVPNEPPPEFHQWVAHNEWYTNDTELRDVADDFGFAIIRKNPSLPPAEVLKQVEAKVKKMYPEKFSTPGKAAPAAAAVESGGVSNSGAARRGSKLTEADLDDTARTAMNTFVKRGILTKEQYLDQLAKSMGMK